MKFKIIGAAALATVFALTGCSGGTPNPVADFDGKATIQKAERHSRKGGCILTVKTYNGLIGDVRVGRRTSCDGWHVGNVVFLNDGKLIK
ncbi:lipoprotein [Arthrobacter phage Atuin]|nr:lipoprotein [Arthrobacter phage Atuin]